MANLITSGQVIHRAFTRSVSDSKIKEGLIQAAQYKYIRPVLGEDLYDALVAAPDDSSFATLLEYVKEALAWYVKYMALPEIYVEIADTGVKLLDTQNTTNITDQRFIELRNSTLVVCENKVEQLTDYLNDDDTDFSDYSRGDNVDNGISMAGGIITRKNPYSTYEDDCPEKWIK